MTCIVYKLKENVGDWENNSSIRYVIEYSTLQGLPVSFSSLSLALTIAMSEGLLLDVFHHPLLSLKISINCMENNTMLVLKLKCSSTRLKKVFSISKFWCTNMKI